MSEQSESVLPKSRRDRVRVSGLAESPEGVREYVVRSTKLIAPGESGPIPYRLRREARVVDVDAGDEAELVRIALGTRRIHLEPEGEERKVLAEVLSAEPYDGSAGAFVVLNVRNTGNVARYVEATIRVASERGPEVSTPSPVRMNADGKIMGSGRPLRRPGRPVPFSPEPRIMMPPEVTSRRPGGGLRRPPPGGERSRAARERVAKTPPIVTVPPVVAPSQDGEIVVVFYRVHVEALVRLLAFRAPIRRPQRAALVRELAAAADRGAETVTADLGKVGVSLERRDLDRLHDALRLHREQQLEDEGDRLALAFNRALAISPQPSADSDQHETAKNGSQKEKRAALTLLATGTAVKNVSTYSSLGEEGESADKETTEE